MERKRWNKRTAAALVAAILVGVGVLAVITESLKETKVNLNDAAIWVTSTEKGKLGRINTQIGVIEVAVSADHDSFDVDQVDDGVFMRSGQSVTPIDVAMAKPRDAVELPENSRFRLGGPTVAVLTKDMGQLWTMPRSQVAGFDAEAIPAVAEAGAQSILAVGVDGATYAYGAGGSEVQVVGEDGSVSTRSVSEPIAEPQITAVGDRVVLLDPGAGRVVVPGGGTVDISSFGDEAVVQQPGAGRDSVVVATSTSLLDVPLGGGDVRVLSDKGAGGAVHPVWSKGCAFGAWAGEPRYAQICDGREPREDEIPNSSVKPGAKLTFRVNRERVLLNETVTGANLLFRDDDEPLEIDDWTEALDRNEQEDQDQQDVVQEQQMDCSTMPPPKLNPDEAGTRTDRPVIVRVLDNDEIPPCGVAVVDVPTPPAAEAGVVAVVDNGAAIQVTPSGGRTAPIAFSYRVRLDDSVEATADVVVKIVPDSERNVPTPKPDATTVESGKSVRHDVLANDTDPDGDALTLVEVSAIEGVVTYRADGQVTYTADGGALGPKEVRYTVEDETGDRAESTLTVTVISPDVNQPPTPRNDRVEAFVGRTAEANLLANDSDPNDDPLTVSNVEVPPDLDVRWEPDGSLSVNPGQAKSWTFTYEITDGNSLKQARVRVDAREPEDGAPIAVRDDLIARPGIPAIVDLLANDIDPNGDVLAVTSIAAPEGGEQVAVELLEMRVARVTAPAVFTRPVVVRYTVSDGSNSATGVLVVRPNNNAAVDQPPVTGDDSVTVRAGNTVAIPVLVNDLDPEGEQLTIRSVDALEPTDGLIFVEGTQLRYRAPVPGPLTTRVGYTVSDPAGNLANGLVTIRVTPDSEANQPPRGPQITTRVFAGSEISVRVPLLDVDPDGDVVSMVGVADPPRKGHVRVIPEGFVYEADRGASGTDTFTFTIRDARGAEATGTVRVAVVPKPTTNSSPVAVPDSISVKAGDRRPIAVLANDSDPDGDPLTLLTTGKDAPTDPSVGEVTVDDNRLVYQAPGSVDGEQKVSMSYSITDGRGGMAQGIATVTISPNPENAPPIARDDIVAIQAPGSAIEVDVLANDADPDGDVADLKLEVVDGNASVVGGNRVRVTAGDRSTTAIYRITDAGGASAQAVITVPVGQAPIECALGSAEVEAGRTVNVAVLDNCKDPAGAKLTLVKVQSERGGSVKLVESSNSVDFTAQAEVRGDAGFSFVVSNGTSTAVGGVRVTVKGQNQPPTFASTRVEFPAGGERIVDLAALTTDDDADAQFSYFDLSGTTPQVSAEIVGGTRLRVSAPDTAKGATATLTVKVDDGGGNRDVIGTLEVRVLKHDGQPPVAVDDQFETTQDKAVTLAVTQNDVDPLGKGLKVEVLGQPLGGTASVEGESIRFTPAKDFFGGASVTYRVIDSTDDADRASSATARVNVIGFPSAPGVPSGIPESRQVRLSWGAASPNGAPVTGYVVEAAGVRQECPSTSCVITGLTNGTGYSFRVGAKNRAVENDAQIAWSGQSPEIIPDTRPDMPDAPVLTFGDREIEVRWTPPRNDGTPITNYELRISGGGLATTRDMGTATSSTWTGLTNGTSYSFQVRAKNDSPDWSEWSPPMSEIPAGLPAAPPGMEVTRLSGDGVRGGSLRVSWNWSNADLSLTNGDPATYFIVDAHGPRGDSFHAEPTFAGTSYSIDAAPLTNGVDYTFEVRAVNKAGTGDAATGAMRAAGVPGAPSGVSASPGDRVANISYIAPSDEGESIQRYEYTAGSLSGTLQGSPIQQGGSNGSTQPHLANGTDYAVRLRACNVIGCGDYSAPSNVVNPFGAPGTPTVSSSVSGTTIRWTWNVPDGNGRPFSHFQMKWQSSSSVDISESTQQTSWDHDPGHSQSRTLCVRAFNSEGRESGWGCKEQSTPPPPRSVTLSRGSAVAPGTPGSIGCGSPCYRMYVQLNGFAGGTQAVQCWHEGEGSQFNTWAVNVSPPGGNIECFMGPGWRFFVVIDGVQSNTFQN